MLNISTKYTISLFIPRLFSDSGVCVVTTDTDILVAALILFAFYYRACAYYNFVT